MVASTEFTGFPVAALDFYDDLEADNSKAFFTARKDVYDEAVKTPMLALTAALEPEFGAAKIFRPYRDVRFAKDKTPLKTHQGAFVAAGPATGWYVQVGAPGVMVGAGFYDASAERLAAVRAGIDHARHGPELVALLDRLRADGWELGGDTLKTSPRGWPADHPRIDLLRHRSMRLSRSYGFEPFVHTAALLERVREDWRAATPFVDWVRARVPE